MIQEINVQWYNFRPHNRLRVNHFWKGVPFQSQSSDIIVTYSKSLSYCNMKLQEGKTVLILNDMLTGLT